MLFLTVTAILANAELDLQQEDEEQNSKAKLV
jgi:hypothetical protein